MNDFLNGRRGFSVSRMEDIAKCIGTTFAEMVKENGSSSQTASEHQKPSENNNLIILKHTEIIKEFKNTTRAKEANEALLNIERLDPDVFEKLVAHIESVEWGLRVVAEKAPAYSNRRTGSDRRKDHETEVNNERRQGHDRRKDGGRKLAS